MLLNIWVTFLTDWDIWLGDGDLADHPMKQAALHMAALLVRLRD